MTLNPDIVRARASEIEESVARLERFAPLDVDEFISNQDAVDIACHRLMVAIEAALALCYHVSARRFRKAPEVVSDHRGDAYRGVYTVRFADKVYVLHAFQKKSRKGSETPQSDIVLLRQRLKRAATLPEQREN